MSESTFPEAAEIPPKPEEVLIWIYRALDGIKYELFNLRKQFTLFSEAVTQNAFRK